MTPVARCALLVTLIASATLVEPILHHWLHAYETESGVATGLHTADSAIYLQAMEMLSNGFHYPLSAFSTSAAQCSGNTNSNAAA
ncbi:MAG: hypothetical protein VCD00_15935 [Candidatus Hydrogenedentota bacterium]